MEDDTFFYSFNGEQFGPFPMEQLNEMLAEGNISFSGLICKNGTDEWVPLSNVLKESENEIRNRKVFFTISRHILAHPFISITTVLITISGILFAYYLSSRSPRPSAGPPSNNVEMPDSDTLMDLDDRLAEWYLFGYLQGESVNEASQLLGFNSKNADDKNFSDLMQTLGFDSLPIPQEGLRHVEIGYRDAIENLEKRLSLPESQKISLLPGVYSNLFFKAPLIPSTISGDKSPSQVYEENSKSFVTVKTFSSNGNGHGSGFFVAKGGFILTNRHVVERADEIKVVDSSGAEMTPEVLAIGKDVDLALLKVSGGNHPFVTIGKGGNVKPGEQIVILGKPAFADENINLNAGIISRSVVVDSIEQFQIDATINAGNSGGPAFNMKGQVIGVATWKLLVADRFNFLINIDEAIPILEAHCRGLYIIGDN